MVYPARTRCCVPFCRHSTRPGHPPLLYGRDEFICREHWKLIPKVRRRAFARAQLRTNGAMTSLSDQDIVLAVQVENRLWRAMKRVAIETALGELA